MEYIAGFVIHVLRSLAFCAVFFWPGWLVLRVMTFGRFPRLRKPSRDVEDLSDVEVISFIGFVSLMGLVILVATLMQP
ncbi:hypothetical protein [Pigmentiphaga litoralis]|uniref:hypothetical protein n=1 Tax=Pigmentiphaga litoralis TaxID=516702 RepID=UPI003B439035